MPNILTSLSSIFPLTIIWISLIANTTLQQEITSCYIGWPLTLRHVRIIFTWRNGLTTLLNMKWYSILMKISLFYNVQGDRNPNFIIYNYNSLVARLTRIFREVFNSISPQNVELLVIWSRKYIMNHQHQLLSEYKPTLTIHQLIWKTNSLKRWRCS